jgi:hypothetical protein
MDDYPNMSAAVSNRDWQGCARVMFRQLFFCPAKEQKKIAALTLSEYAPIWNEKHPTMNWILPWITSNARDQQRELPELPDDLDPADAEFEDALIEFFNGTVETDNHAERTVHFANAIRSSVLASQIDWWLRDYPAEYQRWKEGLVIRGPTFLDDEKAAKEAETAWMRVDSLFDKLRLSTRRRFHRLFRGPSEVEQVYRYWEQSLQ